jgi:hypothetical protein
MSGCLSPKQWATLRAEAALQGYRLVRSDPADGPVLYFFERFGLIQKAEAGRLAEMFAPQLEAPHEPRAKPGFLVQLLRRPQPGAPARGAHRAELSVSSAAKGAKAPLVAISAEGRRICEGHPGAILTDHEVGLVLDLLEAGLSYAEVAVKFEVSKSCIAHIANGRRRCQTPDRYEPSKGRARDDVNRIRGKQERPEHPPVNESAVALQSAINNSWR